MAWYSYFLLAVPEAFVLIFLTFIVLDISLKENVKSIITFVFLQAAVAFTLSILVQNSIKPLLTYIGYTSLVSLIFRRKLVESTIIALISMACISFFEVTLSLIYMKLFSLDYKDILNNPWKRILTSYGVQLPMLLTALTLYKFKISFKIPLLK